MAENWMTQVRSWIAGRLVRETAVEDKAKFDRDRQLLDDCTYLFADSIREIEELTLELIVSEARAQEPILAARNDSDIE